MTHRALPDDAILVVGAGYLGRRVLRSQAIGTATGLGRSAAGPDDVSWDLDGDEPLSLALPDRYRVLYTVPPAATADGDARLQRLLGALEPPPASFVYISTTGVYGDHGGAVVDETTPIDPETTRATRRVAAEDLLQRWAQQCGTRLCVLRVPGIYGPGRLGTERIAAGEAVLRESDANPGNRIHVDDLAACCIAALTKPKAAGIFNVGDGDHRSSTWFTREVARQAGLPAPPEIGREQAARQFSAMRMSFLSESRRVNTRRMREVLGVVPRYADPVDGIRASLEEERGGPGDD
jgi:nucleoside-diphosphate-sugar epimerase